MVHAILGRATKVMYFSGTWGSLKMLYCVLVVVLVCAVCWALVR